MSKMKIILYRDYMDNSETIIRHSDVIPRIGETVAYKDEVFHVSNVTYDISAEYENAYIIDCFLIDDDE